MVTVAMVWPLLLSHRVGLGGTVSMAALLLIGGNPACSGSQFPGRAEHGDSSPVVGSRTLAPPLAGAPPAADAGSAAPLSGGSVVSDDASRGSLSSPGPCESDPSAHGSIGSAPSPGWWKDFVNEQARPGPSPTFPRVSAPTVAMQIHGADSSSAVHRAYRQWWGHFRACHEQALGKTAASTQHSKDSRSEGYWVARIHQDRDRICAVDVIQTILSDALSACLVAEIRRLPETGGESGILELALTFHIP